MDVVHAAECHEEDTVAPWSTHPVPAPPGELLGAACELLPDGVIWVEGETVRAANTQARMLLGWPEGASPTTVDELLRHARLLDAEGRPVPGGLPIAAARRGEPVRGALHALVLSEDRVNWVLIGARAPDFPGRDEVVVSLADAARVRELQERQEDLARSIAHDLRTPLGVILAHARQLARREEPAPAVRRRAEAIQRSADRMSSMLNELLETAMLEAGKLRLSLQPVDLAALLTDLCGRLGALQSAERLELEVRPAVGPVLADAPRLERVFTNLLTNALKYSSSGSTVKVRLTAEGAHAVVEVLDRGPGLAEHELARLFERFYRAPGSARRQEGMGLGLFASRMLVEAHGGSITASSVQGEGSAFRVRLSLLP